MRAACGVSVALSSKSVCRADAGHRLRVEQVARELGLLAQVLEHQQQALLLQPRRAGQAVRRDVHRDGQLRGQRPQLRGAARVVPVQGVAHQRLQAAHVHEPAQGRAAQAVGREAEQRLERAVGEHHLQVGRGHQRAVGQLGECGAVVAQVGDELVAVRDVAVDRRAHVQQHHLDERAVRGRAPERARLPPRPPSAAVRAGSGRRRPGTSRATGRCGRAPAPRAGGRCGSPGRSCPRSACGSSAPAAA